MQDAIDADMQGLSDKVVFEKPLITRESRGRLNVLRSRFVLAFKNSDTDKEYAKARLVVQSLRTQTDVGWIVTMSLCSRFLLQ